jgi:hypothetical protein
VADLEELLTAFTGLVDTYYAICLAEPAIRDIWSATQADKTLREMELADSRTRAAHVRSKPDERSKYLCGRICATPSDST